MRYKGYGKYGVTPIKPQSRKVTTLRTFRELRQLEQETTTSSVLSNHQWEQLDRVTRSTSETLFAAKLFKCVPTSIWSALRQKSGSAIRYSALQRALLANYRQWSSRISGFTEMLPGTSSPQNTSYLLLITKAVLSSQVTLESTIRTGLLLMQQKQLGPSVVAQRVRAKHHSYWQHRELPATTSDPRSTYQDPLIRENSYLYKR